ncbi:MAG: serine/threonine protein kinase [Polyangiaceae bacterium]|nr:serine/threonine protein kinase [Polyangiaceae bacterium]
MLVSGTVTEDARPHSLQGEDSEPGGDDRPTTSHFAPGRLATLPESRVGEGQPSPRPPATAMPAATAAPEDVSCVTLSTSELASVAPDASTDDEPATKRREHLPAVPPGTTLPNVAEHLRAGAAPARREPVPSREFGRVIAGRYRIVDRLAQGGIGAVYLAEHVVLRAPIALKLLQPQSRDLPELAARFEREAIVGAHVKHPNIAGATDFGTLPDGSCYLVLELVEGTTLEKVLQAGRLPPGRAAQIAFQIADALAALHERGVIHRDIKPSNVMLVERGGPGRRQDLVKLIDFGLARLDPNRLPTRDADDGDSSDRLTSDGIVLGTVAYLPPEAAIGMSAVDERSDLYALGLVLYRMLAGRHPFLATDEVELFRQQAKEIPPPFAEAAPDASIPPALEAIVRRLLEKDPTARFQTATQLLEGLLPLAAGLDGATTRLRTLRPSVSSAAKSTPMVKAISKRDEVGANTAGPSLASDRTLAALKSDARSRSAGRGLSTSTYVLLFGALAVLALVITAMVAGLGPVERLPPSNPLPLASIPTPAVSTPAPGANSLSASGATATNSHVPAPSAGAGAERILLLRVHFRDAIESRSWVKAYQDYQRLAREDPAYFAAEGGRLDAVTLLSALAIGGMPEAAEMGHSLAYELGPSGHDVLFHVLLLKGGSKAHLLVTQFLRDPMLRARLGPPLAVTLRLYQLGCTVSTDVYADAVKHGDNRALLTLGGQLQRCRKNIARERAYRALEKRLLAEQATGPVRP